MSRDEGRGVMRFGPFIADLDTRELRKNGIRIRLQQQPFEVLAALLARPGQLISRDALRGRLWPNDIFVDFDRGLNKAVNRLREILGDDPNRPVYIETLSRRGYRFIGMVERDENSGSRLTSIAVLPLDNLCGDPTEEYFSDGMTDELIGELAQISSLHVISRTSVMRYKQERRKSLPDIARELGADAVIEGTVMKAGGRVRITVQLIRGRDDRHLWSHRFECDLGDVLRLQAEAAQAVAREVRATLCPDEAPRIVPARQVSPEAYQAYLRGNYHLHQNIRGVVSSLKWFERAIELDPGYAEAFAGRAQALIFAGIYEMRPFAGAYTEARAAANKALEIDDRNASAHNALGDVRKGLDWDLEAALTEHNRALELNPSHLLARLWRAETLSRLELHDEALAESARAVSLDPVSPISHNNRAMLLWRARRYDEAIREADLALELDPSHVNAFWWKGLAHAGKGEFHVAIGTLRQGLSASGAPLFLGSLGYVYGLAEQPEEAQQMLAQLHAASQTRHVSPVNFATVYAGLGDSDATFAWLEKARSSRDGRVQQLVQPCFDRLRADPRYLELKRKIGLGAVANETRSVGDGG